MWNSERMRNMKKGAPLGRAMVSGTISVSLQLTLGLAQKVS